MSPPQCQMLLVGQRSVLKLQGHLPESMDENRSRDRTGAITQRNEIHAVKVAHHRGKIWTPEDDRRLLDLIEADKSLILISAILKRPVKSVRIRANYLRRQAKTLNTDQRHVQERLELRHARPDKIRMSSGHLLDPTPELPDDTPVGRVRFPTRIYNLLAAANVKTIGEIHGELSGGDTTFSYSGHWRQDGERFKATLLAKRIAPGPPGVFGMDEIDITVSGRSDAGASASCTGFARQSPGLKLDVTLIRMVDGTAANN
jgi:hypothetical protein